jgi:hypothetical protein
MHFVIILSILFFLLGSEWRDWWGYVISPLLYDLAQVAKFPDSVHGDA